MDGAKSRTLQYRAERGDQPRVKIGDNVKNPEQRPVYTGVELQDDVFCGPSMVFTNVINRAAISIANMNTAALW